MPAIGSFAIGLSVALFFLAHLPNGGRPSVLTLVNSALFSLVASLFYLRLGFGAAVGFHYGWNLVQWTLLGYPMYGDPVGRWLHVVPVGPSWLTGDRYGPENSALSGLVLATGLTLLILNRG